MSSATAFSQKSATPFPSMLKCAGVYLVVTLLPLRIKASATSMAAAAWRLLEPRFASESEKMG